MDVAANLVFKVTFLNAGNFQEVKVPVTLTVSSAGKTVLERRQKVVQSILEQQTTTVSFGNLQLPARVRRQRHGPRRYREGAG